MKHPCILLLVVMARLMAVAGTEAPAASRLVITSTNQFTLAMKSGIVTYNHDVHVVDPQMRLTCDWLQATQPEAARHIVARTNVVIDLTPEKGQKWHVNCDQAIYDFAVRAGVTNETVTLSGHAIAKNDQMTIKGEPLVYDKVAGEFTGTGYEMTFNHSAANMLGTNSDHSKTNQVPPP